MKVPHACRCVFILVQLLYTVVTLLPVVWLWESFPLHLAYLVAIYTYSVWNGGERRTTPRREPHPATRSLRAERLC